MSDSNATLYPMLQWLRDHGFEVVEVNAGERTIKVRIPEPREMP